MLHPAAVLRCLLTLCLSLCAAYAHAQNVGETVTKTGTIRDNLYLAGGQVDVDALVRGDVVAAGGRVSIGREVKDDVTAAGGTIDIKGTVGDDLRVAGGSVNVNAAIAGDAIVAGGSVKLSPETTVAGRAWFAGRKVEVAGRFERGLEVSAATIVIAGTVRGDVALFADAITIQRGARIDGNVRYTSRQAAVIDPGAQITGQITHEPIMHEEDREIRAAGPILALLPLLSIAIAASVLFLLFPAFSVSAARTITTDPWKSLGLGLAVLATTPFVGVLLMITVLGIPLALVLLMLYLAFLFVGLLIAVLYLADLLLLPFRRKGTPAKPWQVLAILLAVIVIALIGWIPLLGGLLLFLLFMCALGALTLALYRRYAFG